MRALYFIIILLLCAGCGGSEKNKKKAKVISVKDYETRTFTVEAKDPEVQGLLGNVTQDELERVFGDHRAAMMRCYEEAIYDLEEIEGSLRFDAVVVSDGSVESAFISKSDLGSLETESCMLEMVRGFTFSRAKGGDAVIYYPMELEAPYDPPALTIWSRGDVSDTVADHKSEIKKCLRSGSGALVTLYVGQGGVVLSAGASADTAEAYEGAVCVAKAARSWTFRDPGADNLVKVSLAL